MDARATPKDLELPLRVVTERLGAVTLEVECLNDLDSTIDVIIRYLERTGQAHELQATSLCPYFGVVWGGARALVELVSELALDEVRTKTFLEVGCGLALPSLALARRGASIVATDCHPEVPTFLRRNLARNAIPAAALTYVHADWTSSPPPGGARFDRVIGSDLLYERPHVEWLATFLEKAVAKDGLAVVVDPGRPHLQPFVDRMEKGGFRHEIEVRTTRDEYGRRQDVFVLTFRFA